VSGAAGHADPADDVQNEVLGRHAGPQLALDIDGKGLRLALQQALRGKTRGRLGGADTEGECAECAVRAGMTIAADDGHAGLRAAQFRADDVHDAAPRIAHVEQLHPEFGGIALELPDLFRGRVQLDGNLAEHMFGHGRRRMIHGRQGSIGAPHAQIQRLQDAERLRRGDLMNEVQIDVENRGRNPRSPAPLRAPSKPCRRGYERS